MLYTLTEEHRKQFEAHTAKWIANALNCDPMNKNDKNEIVKALNGMYEAAKLKKPKNIVFVSSPLILCLAGPLAAGIWYFKKNHQFLINSTEAAIGAAAGEATEAATRDATQAATEVATEAST